MVINMSMNKDLVYHPAHYNSEDRPECWTMMENIFGIESTGIFDILNAYKYYYRAGEKDGNPKDQDLEKLINYLNHAKLEASKINSSYLIGLISKMENILSNKGN